MAEISQNNKRIAKNTMMLYIRMFVMLAVGLYTSRVVLEVLGVTDYGIYNIIGGVVVLFSFLNSALTSATQRFLNYNLGKKNADGAHRVFCMSMNAYILLSVLLFVLAETIGLWFVNTQLNIPPERDYAAFWVYQFTILTFIVNLLRIPYNASIIAYERMDFYAYISLIEVILKLLVVYLLYITTYDKLIFYSLLYMIIPFVMNVVYKIYCNRFFETTRYKRLWDKEIFRSLFSFSGWSLFGSLANMSAQQGINILINVFYGVTANAAVGIANQVTSHVYQFVSNFQTAFQPQIVKTYAANETEAFYKLIFRSSKFSYYMMFVLAFPIILTTQYILEIWLVEVPQYTAIFCQLILGYLLIECIIAPLFIAVQATGNIRKYQIWVSICIFLNFPLTYFVFEMGMPIYTAWIIRIIVQMITFVVRSLYMKRYLNLPIFFFLQEVIRPILLVSIISIPIPLILTVILENNLINFVIIVVFCLVVIITVIYFWGLKDVEKLFIKEFISKKLIKKSV